MSVTKPTDPTRVEGSGFSSQLCEDDTNLDSLLCDHQGVDFHVRQSQIPGARLGIISTAQIGQGEDIFCKEQFCIVDDNHLSSTCDNCLQWIGRSIAGDGRMCGFGDSRLEVKLCVGCRVVSYCTKVRCPSSLCPPFTSSVAEEEVLPSDTLQDCQRAAWRQYHKQECELLAGRRLPLLTRALVRLLIKKANSSPSDRKWRAIHRLESHYDLYRQASEWERVVSSSKAVRELLKLEVDDEAIRRLYCQVSSVYP